jgi:hypothetical protein
MAHIGKVDTQSRTQQTHFVQPASQRAAVTEMVMFFDSGDSSLNSCLVASIE